MEDLLMYMCTFQADRYNLRQSNQSINDGTVMWAWSVTSTAWMTLTCDPVSSMTLSWISLLLVLLWIRSVQGESIFNCFRFRFIMLALSQNIKILRHRRNLFYHKNCLNSAEEKKRIQWKKKNEIKNFDMEQKSKLRIRTKEKKTQSCIIMS